ncbi:TSC complex subunit 1a isoform X2 [Melanotaenia boesemani]|uniref:TSC complex subunit 1a isoform X2 n=1 Tax=Melanotaenia boesemani TaxID=1250792 RepID=UPI001C054511|nr:TSC complex subunit 1a isoform X2 [Melanotaenia boesemani]
MSREQVSIAELLLSLDSSDLQEAEQMRAAVHQRLSTDRGGIVLSSLVDHYLDSSSSQAVLLLSSIREPHHKTLLEKLNESLSRPGSRLAAVTLLGHLIGKQPPWVHHISQSPLLPALLRFLKTDNDVVFLITGVLVLITLLPMIPQAGKQHIYDFFDVFGRLASWSYKNPGRVPMVYVVHLQAGVYSLFHRLYGMFPCNFMSYLRLHYSMKENLDTFQEVVKPMLEHVRVHPQLVTGTQDNELDPSRWRCYEVHDIVIECSKLSVDPLESSCEEDIYSSSSVSSRPPSASVPLLHLDLKCTPPLTDPVSSTGSSTLFRCQLTPSTTFMQTGDVTWSPSSQCGLSTPPLEPGPIIPPQSRCTSVSGVTCSSLASVAPPTADSQVTSRSLPKQQPITAQQQTALSDVINNNDSANVKLEESLPPPPASSTSAQHLLLTSTPSPDEGGPSLFDSNPAPLYESLFELTLPRAATMFVGKKTLEAMQRAAGEQQKDEDGEEDHTSISPLQALDQMIIHGHEAHKRLSWRSSAGSKVVDWGHCGGKQQSMRSKDTAQVEEPHSLNSQLLLVHSQLQYERFKRQQHAIRNRRLLRIVISATALEEHNVTMKSQLVVLDEEIRCLKFSLNKEQGRYADLQRDMKTQSEQLHDRVRRLLQRQQEDARVGQRLQSELQESQGRLRDLEAELQKANNKAYNAEHQLIQLSLKLCSSEQLQQQIFLLNQQLVLLREANRSLSEQLEGGDPHRWTEAAMLRCSLEKEFQRLKDSDVQLRQKLEAANHKAAELENQLAKKEQLILDQKRLLEETKNQSSTELSASESRCLALKRVTQTLQTEMLHLYSLVHLDAHGRSGSMSSPVSPGYVRPRPSSSSAVGIINGAVEALSTSPLHLSSCSSSIESLLAVGSFLEQRARQLFSPTSQSPEEEEEQKDKEEEKEEAPLESLPLGQEVEEAMLLTGSPGMEPVSRDADPVLTVQQRRTQLGIMDYDESLPEF